MQKYRRVHEGNTEGVTVHAVQLTKDNVHEVAEWCTGQEVVEIDALDNTKTYVGLNFIGWAGMERASEGDYIIKDNLGDFHSRWPTSFEQYFEKMED